MSLVNAACHRRLIPGQSGNPSQPGLFQFHRVVERRRALVEYQRDAAACDLILIQQALDARQSYGELFDIGHVARIDVMA